MIFRILFLLLCISTAFNLYSDEKRVKFTPSLFTNSSNYYLALSYTNFNDWHTYYKNPGDSGEPTSFKFFIENKEIKLNELEWPFPETYNYGGINTYGYSKRHTIFFKLEEKLLGKKIKIITHWLSCKKTCVPGRAENTLTLNKNKFTTNDILETDFSLIPETVDSPRDLTINLTRDEMNNKIVFYYKFRKILKGDIPHKRNLIIPLPKPYYAFTQEKLVKDKHGILTGFMKVEWDGEFEEPPVPFPSTKDLNEKIVFDFVMRDPNTGKSYKFSHKFTSDNKVRNIHIGSIESVPLNSHSIWYYLLFALIGGFILNLMPCVLPVISLKLFGLIKHKNEGQKKILKHNIAYTIGVLLTFLVLATFVTILKFTGEQIGWGFQLQSPTFIGIMIFALFIFSLNMFGLFEFITPGGSTLGNLQLKDSFLGDILSGVLAVILSTPCSAPFLGTALTFAFTSPPIFIYLFFLMIGLGLALPFIVTGLIPSALVLLPKPGNWMNYFKKFLAMTLLITVIWLIDVLTSLVPLNNILIGISPALLLVLIGILIKNKSKIFSYILYAIAILFLSAFIILNQTTKFEIGSNNQMIQEKAKKGLYFELWAPDRMGTEDQIRFVDFSAKWCLTCKINEGIVLNTKDFKDIIKKHNVKLLLADWTRGDPVITKWLKEHGYVGVPAYFTVSKSGKLYDLGETITVKEIEESFIQAKNEATL